MQKERKVTEEGKIIVFDRDVEVSELNSLLTKEFNGDVIINGKLLVNEDFHAKYNLHVMKDIFCTPDQDFTVKGDLYCYNEIAGYNILVEGCFYCEGIISADNIKVTESFWCKNRIEAYGGNITVLGDFACQGIKAKSVETYGQTYMGGYISVRSFIKYGY